MRILDSRRLTGPSLLLDGPGAILDVALDGIEPNAAMAAWSAALARLCGELGWPNTGVSARRHAGGLSRAVGAPPDVLYAATEVNEAAWQLALGALQGADAGAQAELLAHLREAIERERKPWWSGLAKEAAAHGVTLLMD